MDTILEEKLTKENISNNLCYIIIKMRLIVIIISLAIYYSKLIENSI